MRNEKRVIIPPTEGNRDGGKHFVIVEMSASSGFEWGMDALRTLARAGADVLPDDIQSPNMAMLAGLGFRALSMADGTEVKSLMDRLMACVNYVPDPSKPQLTRGPQGTIGSMDDSCIEEVSTHFLLRKEAWSVSLGFLLTVMQSKASAAPVTAPSP